MTNRPARKRANATKVFAPIDCNGDPVIGWIAYKRKSVASVVEDHGKTAINSPWRVGHMLLTELPPPRAKGSRKPARREGGAR